MISEQWICVQGSGTVRLAWSSFKGKGIQVLACLFRAPQCSQGALFIPLAKRHLVEETRRDQLLPVCPWGRDMSLQYFRCFMASLALVLGSKLTLACSPCAKAQFGSVQPSANAFTNSSELLRACNAWDSALSTRMAGEMQGPTTSQLNCRKMSRKENELSETSPIVHATGLAG